MNDGDRAMIEAAKSLDKFYTRPETVDLCLDFLRQTVSPGELDVHDLWIEPSAGAGAFLDRLPFPRIGIDIDPGRPDILAGDFLGWDGSRAARHPIVVGNPPFGRNARLAVMFFNHAALFAARIAFVVPRTFEKASIANRLSMNFVLEGEITLPGNSFELAGHSWDVPTAFQIWTRSQTPRSPLRAAMSHPDFSFGAREQAAFALQRVGVNAGRIKRDFETVAAASHYFIVPAAASAEELLRRFSVIDFSAVKHRTAGNPSISKAEIIALYSGEGGDVCQPEAR